MVLNKTDPKSKSEKPLLLDILTQISELQLSTEDSDSKTSPSLKTYEELQQKNEAVEGTQQQEEAVKFQPKIAISKALLSDHRFQVQIWVITHSLYMIASSMMKHERPGQQTSQEIIQKFLKVKKEIENIA